MADISLLFDVAGGGSLSGESGKRIQEQLTAIVDKINSDPLKIKIVADDKSIEDLRKKIDELKKAVGSDGIIKIESSDLNGMAKTLNQISSALQHMMIAVGKNGAQLGKFSEQLQNIFEAIPENSNLTTKQINKITDSFSELVDKVEELNVTVGQLNDKKFGATINIAGGVQESAEQVEAYRKYLLALLKDFADLQYSYRHLMGESNNPKMANMAYAASAAVNGNKKLYDAIQNFNFGDMKAQAGFMDFDQLKEAIGLYKSLIASMVNIRYKGNEIFSAGDQSAVNAALQQIREVESSMDNLGEAPAGGAGEGGSIFDFIDKVREGIEALQDPLGAVRKVIDETFTFGEIPEDKRTAMVKSVTALSNEVSKVFTNLRVKITETFDFSSLSEDGRKEYIESIRSECLQIEGFFDQLREKILATFDLSDVDTSSISGIIERIQTEFNNLTLDLGNINVTGTIGRAVEEQSGNFVRETRPLKDLIPDTVKIADSISSDTLDKLSDVMQGMRIAEGDAGSLANLFKDLSGTVTEVTTKIVDQGRETEYLKNVTIKGVDEMGQAFSRSADYVLKHSKKNGDYFEDHTTTIRKQIIAEQERTKAVKESADARTEAANEEIESEEKLTRAQERAWEERNRHLSEQAESENEIERAYAQYAEQLERAERAEEKLARTQTESFEKSQETADRARDRAEEEANSIERRNKLLTESNNLIAKIQNMSAREGVTDEQSGQFGGIVNAIHAYQDAVTSGRRTNEDFAEWLNGVKLRMSELGAEFSAAEAPIKMLKEGTSEYADALKNIQTTIGNAQNALTNFSAAEKSSNESSRTAYQNIGNQIQKLRELEAAVRAGSISEKDFKTRLSDINTEIKENSNVIRENGDAHKSLGEGIAKTIKNFSQWLGVSRILMGAIRTIKQMVSAVIELDTAMTELRKVTDETEARYDKFLEDAGVRAKQVGASLRDTVSATADFARLGYSVDQAEKLADAAIIYKNVGDGISDISEASESIIATMQAFNIAPESVMSIVDKFNEVGNRFAISSSGVGEALLRSASALHVANNSLEESIGLAAAANTIVQNPQIVGTTLKTVSMYLRAAKTELQEAGEETEGIAESTSELRELILQITRKYGEAVDIMSDDNTFKSTYEILHEISRVWDKITDEEDQAALLKKLGGGVRNGNAISAILENFEIAERAMTAAQDINALGSAVAENDKVLQSIQGRINLFKATFEDLSRTVVNGDLVKVVIDSGTWIMNTITSITKLIDSLGGLRTVLILVGGVMLSMNIGKIETGFTALGKAIKGVFTSGFSLKTLFSQIATHGIGLGGAIGIITAALTAASAAYSLFKRRQEEARQSLISTSEQSKADAKSLIDLFNNYSDLSDSISTNAGAKEELEGVTDELLKRLGIEGDLVGDLSGEYETLSEKIKSITLDELYKKRADIEGGITAQEEAVMDAYSGKGLPDKANPLFTGINYNEVYARRPDSGIIKALRDAGYGSYLEELSNGNVRIDFGRIDDAYDVIEMFETIQKMKTAISMAGGADTDLFSKLTERATDFAAEVNDLKVSIKDLNEINQSIYGIENPEEANTAAKKTIEKLTSERDALVKRTEALNNYISAYEDLVDIEQEAESAGYSDISETIFGNIDTNNRQILDWTQENIDKYRDILASWGYTEEDLQEMLGSFSTVMGTSMNFDGLEIAFSPILQTEDGPVLLSHDTVEQYISSLMRELGSDGASWTDEDLLRIDTRGLEIDGVTIKNLLASVGSEAIRVGEVMHYAGSDGALADAFLNMRSAANKAGVSLNKYRDRIGEVRDEAEKGEQAVEDLNRQISALAGQDIVAPDYRKDITEYVSKIGALTGAWREFQENGKITSQTYQLLNKEFEDESGLVEIVNGKLSLNADAVEKLNEKLRDEYGLKVALAGASEEEISYIDRLAGELENLSSVAADPTSELKELTGVLGDMAEGVELGTFDILELIQKYPQLRDKIIKTANGYKVEESAIRDLIKVKSQLLTLNEREIGITSARAALISDKGETPAQKIDKIFADFEAANGRAITSAEDFAEGYLNEFGKIYAGSYDTYQNYVNALIDLNNGLSVDANALAMVVEDLNSEVKERYDPTKEEKSSSAADKEETAFEKAYKLHQHYLAMDQETEEQYLSWLEGAYKASYAAGEMELDDYYKYEEEVYEKRKALFSQSLDETQHQIDLLSHQMGDTSQEQIALYEQMQKSVNQKANEYRAAGIKENDELIRELQNQWWQYEDNIRQLRENAFSDWLNDKKFLIDQLKQDGASSDEILNSWKEVLTRINDEIAYYLSKGYDITSDVIQNLMGELKDAKDSITDALDEIVSKANEVVDGFQNVYTTLTNAAKEYASTGYLSVDSLQSILELGPKYMDMLYDESGQLTINEEALQKVIAARTEEMAAETALSYAKQVLLATEGNESQKLKEFTNVQAASSSATWDMAYATLGYAKALGATKGISDEYYEKAIQYVTRMQSVTKTATDSISDYYKTLDEGYVSQADGLETILKLTEDMLKQENSDRIKQLEDEKDAYKDIIDQKKEILRLTKEQQDHDRDMADKLKEIADLQSKIDQLALDDSREARAQRSKLEAELLEKQKALTDSQNDYAYDAQVDALDKQYDEYEKELDKEADALKDELNSAEKLYRAAIDRISNGWDTLYNDLLNWNYNYGNTLEKDLTNAWKAAQDAAERYGDFVSAMEGVKQHDKLGDASSTPTTEAVQNAVAGGASTFTNYRNRMYENSLAWYTADNPAFFAAENQRLAKEYEGVTGNRLTHDTKSGYWYENGSSDPFYTLDRNEVGMAVVAAMKANSGAWKGADPSTQRQLAARNQELADRLASFLKKPITKTAAGVWMLGNTPLYEVTKFHTGGIVGGRGSLRQNEVMSLLKKGEAVLDERREEALYKTVDFVQMLSDKIGHVIDKGRLSSLLAGTGASFPKGVLPALAGGGIGTMNFAPTIQVTIAGAGDLTEAAARKYGNIAAESALAQLKNAFTQRGVSAPGNSILK